MNPGESSHLLTRKALSLIHEINRRLYDIAQKSASLPKVQYSIEVVEIDSMLDTEYLYGNTKRMDMHVLRVIREELPQVLPISRFTLDPTITTRGAREIVSEYFVYVTEKDKAHPHLNTFCAMDAYREPSRYEGRGFSSLLTHLLIYCCAKSFKNLQAQCVHPATMHLFSKYTVYAQVLKELNHDSGVWKSTSSIGLWWIQKNDQIQMEKYKRFECDKLKEAIENVVKEAMTSEKDLVIFKRDQIDWNTPALNEWSLIKTKYGDFMPLNFPIQLWVHIDSSQLDEEKFDELSKFARNNCYECLEKMDRESHIKLSALSRNPYTL
jgi:hypothetical protein